MIVEFLEITFSRHDTCKLLCDTSLALARSSPTRRYTGKEIGKSVVRTTDLTLEQRLNDLILDNDLDARIENSNNESIYD